MRYRLCAVAVVVLAVAALPLAAGATLIEVTSVARSVTASADHEGPGSGGALSTNTATSSSPAGAIQASASSPNPSFPFHRTLASNRQTSTVVDDGIGTTGTGEASATDFMLGFGTYAMEFVYDITFQVTAPSSFEFSSLQFAGYAPMSVSATLFDPDNLAIFDETRNGAGSQFFSETGTVDPGLHRLLISVTRSGSTTEEPGGLGYSLTASLDFTQIPEPTSSLLVIAGLLGLAGWRRERP